MDYERRMAPRKNVRHSALVIRLDDSIVDTCTVSNISARGAQLSLAVTNNFPNEFNLVLSKGGAVRRRCEVVWQNETHVGVRFVVPQKP
jgi:PilZ domain